MKVFNLTETHLHFQGRSIPPLGGWLEYPDSTFFPDRDLKLQDQKIIAIGQLPAWYIQQEQIKAEKRSKAAEPPQAVVEEAKAEPQETGKKRR